MALLYLVAIPDILAIFVALVLVFNAYYKWSFGYWERRKVPFMKPKIPFGSVQNPLKRKQPIFLMFKNFRDHFKALGYKHGGVYVFSNPIYVPVHPEYIKNILSKDFLHFTDRGLYVNERDDPLSAHLFNMEGEKWRNLRQKFTPTFTSGKMKTMFSTLRECGLQMKNAIDVMISKGDALDIKEIAGCFTTDIIGSCAFGIDCDSFKNPDGEFRKYGKKIFVPSRFSTLMHSITFNFPKLSRRLGLTTTDPDVANFFTNIVKKTISYRESNNLERKDFMQLLINLKKNGNSLTVNEIIAQSFVFFSAGFEASSTTMTYCLFELAINQDIQDKVREEIETVLAKYDGEISYDAIGEMKYLGQVLDETLRKYPVVGAIPRKVTKTYKIPGEDIILEKDQKLWISVYSLHYDEEYFPDPERFDPDRFSEENKVKLPPFVYIPFGEGPRFCIGLRFGLMQTKVGIITFLRNYRLSLNKKTVTPLEYDPSAFVMTTLGTIWLDAERIN